MKKQVNIITYCNWKSIGSVLQSYALSTILEKSEYKNAIWLEDWSRRIEKGKGNGIKGRLIQLYKSFINRKIEAAYRKRMAFINENMNARYFSCDKDFENAAFENKDDVFLSGSDQVWNPDRCNPVFFLDFAKESKCISYAASMGNTKIKDEKKDLFKSFLSNFDSVSVREQECKEVLENFTDKEISVNIDPTFLIDIKKWRELEKKYEVKKPYILLYMLYWDNSLKEKIKNLKKRTGLPVYAICPDVSRVYADKHLYDVGIEEFLWLVDNAEYVVTSSFHGVAFSIIFNKKFSAIANPASPSRIDNIMNVLSVPKISIDELDIAEDFDYDSVNEKIKEQQNKSIDYLKEAIG